MFGVRDSALITLNSFSESQKANVSLCVDLNFLFGVELFHNQAIFAKLQWDGQIASAADI